MAFDTSSQGIAYERAGSGEPVMLIHGIGHRRQAWARVPELLAETNDVITIDLPGNGDSRPAADLHSYGMRAIATQITQFASELGLERWHVAGNSLGGYLSLELARRGAVASATALSPAGFWTPLELVWTGINLNQMWLSSHAPEPVLRKVAADTRLRRLAMASLYVHGDRLSEDDFVGDARNMRQSASFWRHYANALPLAWKDQPVVPTTVAWGDKDRLLLPRQAKRARKRMPQVEHVTLPNCGHCPMLDEPELVTQVIRDTMARA